MHQLTIQTSRNNEVVDITSRLNTLIQQEGVEAGLCHVFITHTTAAITTADLDPGTDQDMLDAYFGMLPDIPYRHPHNPDHAPDHILATLMGPDVTVPVKDGRLVLGTWQRVVLFEFDGGRKRNVMVSFVG